MNTLVINVGNDININDFFAQLKKIYPSVEVLSSPKTLDINTTKKFTGTSDLVPIYVSDFKMYERDELYDR